MQMTTFVAVAVVVALWTAATVDAACPRCFGGGLCNATTEACECTLPYEGEFCERCADGRDGPFCTQSSAALALSYMASVDAVSNTTSSFGTAIAAWDVVTVVGSLTGSVEVWVLADNGTLARVQVLVDSDSDSLFGAAVALDNGLLAVGAPNATRTSDGLVVGAVAVYDWVPDGGTGGAFVLLSRISGSSVAAAGGVSLLADALDGFGGSLAVAGPTNTIVVGHAAEAASAGTISLLVASSRTAAAWAPGTVTVLGPFISPTGSRAGGRYGASLALVTLTAFGTEMLVVGEPCTACASALGLVAAFVRSASTAGGSTSGWFLDASSPHRLALASTRCASAFASNARFGTAIATDGDWLAISAPGDSSVCVWRALGDGSGTSAAALTPIISVSRPSTVASVGATFGAALAFSAGRLFVGVPDAQLTGESVAAGVVAVFWVDATDGALATSRATLAQVVAPPARAWAGALYGSAIALGAARAAALAPESDALVALVGAPSLVGSAFEPLAGAVLVHAVGTCGLGQVAAGFALGAALDCTTCAAGTTANSFADASTVATGAACLDCDAGLYLPDAGLNFCFRCPAGTSNAARGAVARTACEPCAAGSFTNSTGRSTCLLCQPGFSQNTTGATACRACPAGADCRALGTGTPVALAGWYENPNAPGTFLPCASPTSRCAGAGLCATGYSGAPACAECATGYFVRQDYSTSAECSRCPSYVAIYAIGLVLIILFVAGMLVKLAKSATVFMTSIGVGLNFIQIVAVLATFDFNWPTSTQSSLNIASLSNLNLELFSIDCFARTGLSPLGKMVFKMTLPLMFMALFASMYLAVKLFACCCTKSSGRLTSEAVLDDGVQKVSIATRQSSKHMEKVQASKSFEWAIINAALAMLNLIYISLTLTTLEIYDCRDELNTGVRTVRSSPTVVCGSAQWRSLRRVSIICGALYGLGIPLLFFALLFRRRHKLHHRAVVLQLGMLFRKYRVAAFLWELVILLRKIVIVSLKLFSSVVGAVARLRIIFIVLVLATFAQLIFEPYQSRRANRLELFTLLCVDVIALLGLLLAGSLPVKPSTATRSLTGSIVIIIVLVALAVILFAVFNDFRNAQRMKKRGMVGAFATEDVTVFKHFFTSGLYSAAENRMITTTDHFSGLMFGYPVDPRERAPLLEVKAAQQGRIGLRKTKRLAAFDGSILIQHDVLAGLYHISLLFPRPGSYTVFMSGGLALPVPSGCCTRKLSERALQLRLDPWFRQRLLMTYNLIVSESGAATPRQEFVRVERLAERYGMLFSPVEAFLNIGQAFFRVRVPHGRQVVVVQGPNSEVQTFLTREKHSDFSGDKRLFQEDTFSGDVSIEHIGALRVLAYVRQDSVEAVMHQASRQHSRGHQMEHIELLVYAVVRPDDAIPTPSMNLLDAQRQGRRRRNRTATSSRGAANRPRNDTLDLDARPQGAYDYGDAPAEPADVELQNMPDSGTE